jgi:hypothetical protein
LNKIETENSIEIWGVFLVLLESPQQVSDIKEFISTILRANMRKILILEWILLLEIQTICKK